MFNSFNQSTNYNLCAIEENSKYNEELHYISAFPIINKYQKGKIASINLSFNFRHVGFSKKKALPFFLAIELMTGQKSVASLSSRDVQAWKVRKGRLVGCKVTLRNKSRYAFFNSIVKALSRREKFKPYFNYIQGYSKKQKKRSFNLTLKELIHFSAIETSFGNHPDLKAIRVAFLFSTFAKEEQVFIIRYYKLPVNN